MTNNILIKIEDGGYKFLKDCRGYGSGSSSGYGSSSCDANNLIF